MIHSTLSLSDMTGLNGFRVDGIDAGGALGRGASAGDLNGDGIADFIIGAPYADPNGGGHGESYVVFGSSAGFASNLSLSELDGTNGFRIDGIDAGDRIGFSVSSAGDVNGDGIDDLIIGARTADPNNLYAAGETYVVFGSDAGFGSSLSLSALNGSNGFRIDGIDADDYSGTSVSSAGDVNGDGFDDLIIGAPVADANGNNSGESYVVFGTGAGFESSLSLSSLNGVNGFRIDGVNSYDQSGVSVSSAGDVNGDGLDDLIIGASDADPNGASYAGASYVVFGRSTGFASSLSLSELDGGNGFCIDGIDADDMSGRSVSSAGDLNGDGLADLVIGARSADPYGDFSGESYVVFGSNTDFGPSLSLAALDGVNGFRIEGVHLGDRTAHTVSSAGDVNGDGIDDILIGASDESYVIFGTSADFAATLSLSALDGSNGFRIEGRAISSVGDVNHDGIDDLIVGLLGADRDGESYVVFGRNATAEAADDTVMTDAETPLTGNVLADNGNGADRDDFPNNLLRVVAVNGAEADIGAQIELPSGALLTLRADGSFDYDPNGAFAGLVGGETGSDTFTYALTDGQLAPESDPAVASALSPLDGFAEVRFEGIVASGPSPSSAGDMDSAAMGDPTIWEPGAAPKVADASGESLVAYGEEALAPVVDLATVTVTVTGGNDAPVLGGLDGPIAASEQVPLAALSEVTVDDADSPTLTSATVAITGGHIAAEDVLNFANAAGMGNIAGSYDAPNGVLTLTSAGGTATLAQWQVALRSVSYINTSDMPDTGDRTLSVMLSDGSDDSVVGTQIVFVTPINDAPGLSGIPAALSGREDGPLNVDLSGVTLTDPDAGDILSLSLSAGAGSFSAATSNGIAFTGLGTGTLTVSGTLPDLESFLQNAAAVQYTAAQDVFGTGAASIALSIGDGHEAATVAPIQVNLTEVTDTRNGNSGRDSLTGDAGTDLMNGFGGNDILDGGGDDDTLNGGRGEDEMAGGTGNDRYYVGSDGDVVIEFLGEGTDTVISYIASYTLGDHVERLELRGASIDATGNALSNTLVGNALDNTLNGAAGADYMVGGDGNDRYFVAAAGDRVIEFNGQGTDTVISYLTSYTLGEHVERLELRGAAVAGIGNALGNTLVGNALDNTLNGAGGADFMVGGTGDDRYVVASAGDRVIEYNGQGVDTVVSYLTSYTLGDHVERLELRGGAFTGTGNGLNNTLVGNAQDNTLRGGDGTDYISGGAGADNLYGGADGDVFVYNRITDSPAGPASRDTIFDFEANDRITLSNIDANGAEPGNAAFNWLGSSGFTDTAGELRFSVYGSNTVVQADIDGDGAADMEILLRDYTTLDVSDFTL